MIPNFHRSSTDLCPGTVYLQSKHYSHQAFSVIVMVMVMVMMMMMMIDVLMMVMTEIAVTGQMNIW